MGKPRVSQDLLGGQNMRSRFWTPKRHACACRGQDSKGGGMFRQQTKQTSRGRGILRAAASKISVAVSYWADQTEKRKSVCLRITHA